MAYKVVTDEDWEEVWEKIGVGWPVRPGLFVKGNGRFEWHDDEFLRFRMSPTKAPTHSDIQINDHGYERAFRWGVGTRLMVEGRFSAGAEGLTGTAGFGFWNKPFKFWSRRFYNLPRVTWFFAASPKSNMKFTVNAPGDGFKGEMLNVNWWRFALFLLSAPVTVPLMRWDAFYRWFWRWGERALGASEAEIDVDITAWHRYELVWEAERMLYFVDGELVHETPYSIKEKLGFVAWIDNKHAVVTPWGSLAYGKLDVAEEEWMDIRKVVIERMS